MPRFIDLVMKYYQQTKDFLLLLLDKIFRQPIEIIEYYRVDIWGFFKRPELEMVK